MSERSREETNRILDARAIELARRPESPIVGEAIEVVRFRRGDEAYAVETRYVHEVFPLGPVAVLPGVAAPVAGATTWRGGILVLLEPGSGRTERSGGVVVVAIGGSRAEFGLLADAVETVERIPLTAFAATVEGVASAGAGLRGVTREGVLVLEGGELIEMHTQRSGR